MFRKRNKDVALIPLLTSFLLSLRDDDGIAFLPFLDNTDAYPSNLGWP